MLLDNAYFPFAFTAHIKREVIVVGMWVVSIHGQDTRSTGWHQTSEIFWPHLS